MSYEHGCKVMSYEHGYKVMSYEHGYKVMSYEPLDLVSKPYFDYRDRYLLHTVNTRIVHHLDSTSKNFRPEGDVLSRFHCNYFLIL